MKDSKPMKGTADRPFLMIAGVFVALTSVSSAQSPRGIEPSEKRFSRRDDYGGCPEIAFRASGFFRLENRQRWWLVTPEGNAYLSLGVNHLGSSLLKRPYNRTHWQQTFALGEASPASDWVTPFVAKAKADIDAFGFNALGVHTHDRSLRQLKLPYVQSIKFVQIDHWKTPVATDFPDVFSNAFRDYCRRLAGEIAAPLKEDPYLLGYAFTDCPIFTEEEAAARQVKIYGAPRDATPTWPRALRNLGAEAPGKQAYVRLIEQLYEGSILQFNRTYGTFFSSFDQLRNATDWRPRTDMDNFRERKDNELFLEQIVERYYQTAVNAIRAVDNNHLIFGDKLNGNTNLPDWLVALVAEHVDVIFYQWYGFYAQQAPTLDRWSDLTGKPLLNGDGSFSTPDAHMPNPLGPHASTQAQRARHCVDFATQAFARTDFVGWHVCGWMDGWSSIPGKELRQHSGLQTPFGERYEAIVEALSTVSHRLYSIGTSASSPSEH